MLSWSYFRIYPYYNLVFVALHSSYISWSCFFQYFQKIRSYLGTLKSSLNKKNIYLKQHKAHEFLYRHTGAFPFAVSRSGATTAAIERDREDLKNGHVVLWMVIVCISPACYCFCARCCTRSGSLDQTEKFHYFDCWTHCEEEMLFVTEQQLARIDSGRGAVAPAR